MLSFSLIVFNSSYSESSQSGIEPLLVGKVAQEKECGQGKMANTKAELQKEKETDSEVLIKMG